MFSLSPVSTLLDSPYPILPTSISMMVFLYLPHSHLPALDSPIMGHLSGLHGNKDLSSH